jgi:hypothetical protein
LRAQHLDTHLSPRGYWWLVLMDQLCKPFYLFVIGKDGIHIKLGDTLLTHSLASF